VAASLALSHSAVILVGGARKAGDLCDYRLWMTDVIWPEDFPMGSDAAVILTQRITSAIERAVRQDPSQYLWLHRRWKYSPADAAQLSAAAHPTGSAAAIRGNTVRSERTPAKRRRALVGTHSLTSANGTHASDTAAAPRTA
jgi:hypothetical protein